MLESRLIKTHLSRQEVTSLSFGLGALILTPSEIWYLSLNTGISGADNVEEIEKMDRKLRYFVYAPMASSVSSIVGGRKMVTSFRSLSWIRMVLIGGGACEVEAIFLGYPLLALDHQRFAILWRFRDFQPKSAEFHCPQHSINIIFASRSPRPFHYWVNRPHQIYGPPKCRAASLINLQTLYPSLSTPTAVSLNADRRPPTADRSQTLPLSKNPQTLYPSLKEPTNSLSISLNADRRLSQRRPPTALSFMKNNYFDRPSTIARPPSQPLRRRRSTIQVNRGPTPAMPPLPLPNPTVQQRRILSNSTNTKTMPFPSAKQLSNIASTSGTKSIAVQSSTMEPTSVMPTNLTIYGHVDQQLDSTVRTFRKQNVGIVIHDDAEMYRILQESKNRKLEALTTYNEKGKRKGKGKENQDPSTPVVSIHRVLLVLDRHTNSPKNLVQPSIKTEDIRSHVQSLPGYVRPQHTPNPINWDDAVVEYNKIHRTDKRGWRMNNRIYVRTGLRWPRYLDIDFSTFCRLMLRMFKAVRDDRG
ncbi:hypothetical protein LguiB_027490 [Lonicera macranthoides]